MRICRSIKKENEKWSDDKLKELKNGTKIIGIDHGYGNIKSASTVTVSGILKYDTEPIFSGNVLEFNGKYYKFGDGHKEFISDKSLDEDFYLFTLMAVAKELNRIGERTANVYIAAGLPLTWIRTQKDSFKHYLMQNETVSYKFNGKDYNVTFVGCSIYPQGYPAIVEHIKDFTGSNLIADIGNGTMNIMYVNNKKPNESKCWTEKLGVNQCVIAAKNRIWDKFGTKIDESIIEYFLRNGTADISSDYLEELRTAATEYVGKIFEALKRYEYNPDTIKLHILGGGGCLIKNFGQYDNSRVKISNDICAAAKGFEYLAYNKLIRS